MYRGEPLSLWTNIIAIFMIIPLGLAGLYTALGGDLGELHYQIAIQLLVGLLIIGSELQFFKLDTKMISVRQETIIIIGWFFFIKSNVTGLL